MESQLYEWTCSICSFVWVINSTGVDPKLTREEAAYLIGYPSCVNETVGLTSIECLRTAFRHYGLETVQGWYAYPEAFAIAEQCTGVINPVGMYHFMAIRGVQGSSLYVANSAQGYRGVWNHLDSNAYNQLGPTQMLWIPPQ